ncbi:MAG: hypothetical protein V4734_12400, partial [Terriglobus sp.]
MSLLHLKSALGVVAMSRMRGWLVVLCLVFVLPQCKAGCKAMLSADDARLLASSIPNARAFVSDFHAR